MNHTKNITCQDFVLLNCRVPAFELKMGQRIRIWTPRLSLKKAFSGEQIAQELTKIFLRPKESSPFQAPEDIKLIKADPFYPFPFWKTFFPPTIKSYLRKKKIYSEETVHLIRLHLNKDLETDIRRLGILRRKKLGIITAIAQADLIICDYFGLGAAAFEEFEKFMFSFTNEKRAFIVFDNLAYFQEKDRKPDSNWVLIQEMI